MFSFKKYKKVFIYASLLGAIFSSTTQARPNINYFINEYQNINKIMLNSYKETVSEPLDAMLFNIRDKRVSHFINQITQKHQDGYHFMEMHYRSNFKINNNATDFCMIVYDSNKLLQLDRYLHSTFPSPIDSIYYLASHEIGHCFIAHQTGLGKMKALKNPQEQELYAEIFSTLFFLTRNQKAQALSLIKQNTMLDPKSAHYHPERLMKVYLTYEQEKPIIGNMYDLFSLSLNYFYRLNENDNYYKTELDNSREMIKVQLKDANKIVTKENILSLNRTNSQFTHN